MGEILAVEVFSPKHSESPLKALPCFARIVGKGDLGIRGIAPDNRLEMKNFTNKKLFSNTCPMYDNLLDPTKLFNS